MFSVLSLNRLRRICLCNLFSGSPLTTTFKNFLITFFYVIIYTRRRYDMNSLVIGLVQNARLRPNFGQSWRFLAIFKEIIIFCSLFMTLCRKHHFGAGMCRSNYKDLHNLLMYHDDDCRKWHSNIFSIMFFRSTRSALGTLHNRKNNILALL